MVKVRIADAIASGLSQASTVPSFSSASPRLICTDHFATGSSSSLNSISARDAKGSCGWEKTRPPSGSGLYFARSAARCSSKISNDSSKSRRFCSATRAQRHAKIVAWPGGGSPDKLRVGRDNIVRCSCYQAAGVIRQDVPAACLNSGLPMEETEIERAQRHVTEGRRIVAAARARNADLKTRGRLPASSSPACQR